MKRINIKIETIDDLLTFIKLANQIDEPGVFVHKGSIHIDGTSLLGILGLNPQCGVEVIYPESENDFEQFLLKFKIED